jgi:putative solute:sodium symporter small subunit
MPLWPVAEDFQMIELILGLLVLLMAGVLGTGLADGVLPVPAPGLGSVAALIMLGLVLITHSLYRHRRDGGMSDRFWMRTAGTAGAMSLLTALLALVAPLFFAPLGLLKIGGFPVSYYVVAEALPICLVILIFHFVRRQDDIETVEGDRET